MFGRLPRATNMPGIISVKIYVCCYKGDLLGELDAIISALSKCPGKFSSGERRNLPLSCWLFHYTRLFSGEISRVPEVYRLGFDPKKKAFETKIKIISVTTAATTTPRSGFYFNIGEKEVQCEPPADNLQFGANTDWICYWICAGWVGAVRRVIIIDLRICELKSGKSDLVL